MATTPVLWPGESHGGRSLVGYSPWGRKESDTTERLHFHFLSCSLACDLFWRMFHVHLKRICIIALLLFSLFMFYNTYFMHLCAL